MKSKTFLAGLLLACGPAMAQDMPAICNSTINYTAQILATRFYQEDFDPNSLALVKDFNDFPIVKTKFLGNCDEDEKKLKPSWCRVAGGSPDVYKVQVNQTENGDSNKLATMIVTYNRGGCFVDEITRD